MTSAIWTILNFGFNLAVSIFSSISLKILASILSLAYCAANLDGSTPTHRQFSSLKAFNVWPNDEPMSRIAGD